MELKDKTVRVRRMIEHLVRVTLDEKFTFTRSGVVALALQEGLGRLPSLYGFEDIDDERVVDFILYQIYRYRDAIERRSWSLAWLFSQTAFSKFKQQFMTEDGKSGMNYYIDRWLQESNLTRHDLVRMIADPKPNPLRNMVYLEAEEPIKRRFLNTPDGLALCTQSTTGWSPLSPTCKRCENWIECGKITAKKYPELMRFRKEAYNGNQKK